MNDQMATLAMKLEGLAAAWLPLMIDATVKAAVLIVLAGIAVRLLRRLSAAARRLVWLAVLVMLPLLPVLLLTLPGWHILPELVPSQLLSATLPSGVLVRAHAQVADPSSDTDAAAASEVTSDPTGQSAPSPPAPSRATALAWPVWLFSVWVFGTLAVLSMWLMGRVSLWRLEWHSRRVATGPLAVLLKQCAAELRLGRGVALFTSDHRCMPMQWGIMRPRILLPTAAANWPAARLRAVLLHELAHVRRHDCLARLLAHVVVAAFWFHPLVWWAVRQLTVESEAASDDAAITAGCSATDYAEHLLHVAAHSVAAAMPGVAITMARPTDLETRIRKILDSGCRRGHVTATGTIACLVALAGATVALAAMRVQPSVAEADVSLTHAVADQIGATSTTLGYVNDTAEGRRSIAGSGHAVEFERPADADRLMAVEIFASRYGYPEPPDEDFHVYVLDEHHRLLHAAPFPYSLIERGAERWYSLKLPTVEVPRRFVVALAFNPHRTKGVYLGLDADVEQSHSLIGRPTTGYEPLDENRDWMIRAVVAPTAPLDNPFETVAAE